MLFSEKTFIYDKIAKEIEENILNYLDINVKIGSLEENTDYKV